MFLQRVKNYVNQKVLEDEDFDIFSMKEKLEQKRDLSDMDHNRLSDVILPEEMIENQEDHEISDIDEDEVAMNDDMVEIFEQLQQDSSSTRKDKISEISYEQGLKHLAGSIASKFRVDESLGKRLFLFYTFVQFLRLFLPKGKNIIFPSTPGNF